MQFNNTEIFKKREFYPQTGNMLFSLTGYVDRMTTSYKIGLSGSQENMEFLFSGGKVFHNGRFLQAYQESMDFAIQAQVCSSSFNLKKDNQFVSIGENKSTGLFSHIYAWRSDTDGNLYFDTIIDGDNTPNYEITDTLLLQSTGQNSVTGYFINYGQFPIKVFNSVSNNGLLNYSPLSGVSITSQNSGEFSFNGNFDTFDFTQPLYTTFSTSFNDIPISIKIIDVRQYDAYVLLEDLSLSFADNQAEDVLFYNNFSGEQNASFPTNIIIKSEYISGSGVFALSGGGAPYLTTGYGNIFESGLLTGFVSTETGNFTGTVFQWATGNVSQAFIGFGTGIASGLGYTGTATGTFSGLFSSTIYNGSGSVSAGIETGIGLVLASIIMDDSTYATGYLNTAQVFEGDTLYIAPPTGWGESMVQGTNTGVHLWAYRVAAGDELYEDYGSIYAWNDAELYVQWASPTGLIWFLSGHPEMGLNGYYDAGQDMIFWNSLLPGTIGNNTMIFSEAAPNPFGIEFASGANQQFVGGTESNNYYATGYMDFTNFMNGAQAYIMIPTGTGTSTSVSPNNDWPPHTILSFAKQTTTAGTGLTKYSETEYRLAFYGSAAYGATAQNLTGMKQIAWAISGAPGHATLKPEIGITTTYTGGMIMPVRSKLYGSQGTSIQIFSPQGYAGPSGLPGTGYLALSGSSEVFSNLVGITPITGAIDLTITGSGDYSNLISGAGDYFYKTFTGSWDILTGINSQNLFSIKTGNYYNSETMFFNSGTFDANSFFSIRIQSENSYYGPAGMNLIVSGNLVSNPISTILSN